jgi:photosystem II stability/assembly factor-like uncharacterized protein
MEGTSMQRIGVIVLVVALLGFMGTYFWMSYGGETGLKTPIQVKMFSPHDDFFGICQGTGGQAWAVGKDGIILHSKDAGRNWEKQASGTQESLSAVCFTNNQVGFVVGTGGIILATRDGGLSWRMQNSGIKDYLLGVQALDGNKAYAVGVFGTFLATIDGGATWKKSEFSWEKLIPRILEEVSGKVEPNFNSVHFVTPEIGWVVGEFGLILHTRDGGRTWTSQRGGGKLPQLAAVIFRDERKGWALGQQGTLIWTQDGGQHWYPSKIGTDRDLYAAACEDKHIVAVGDHVSLMTENGGSTWARKDFGENLVLTGVALMSKVATVVGQGGVIRRVE